MSRSAISASDPELVREDQQQLHEGERIDEARLEQFGVRPGNLDVESLTDVPMS